MAPPPPPPPPPHMGGGVFAPLVGRQRLEQQAMEANLMFHPLPNRFYQGKQIYRLGNCQVCLDGNVVLQCQGIAWVPMHMEEAIRRAI